MSTESSADEPLPISAAIITLNEEVNLRRCLESVRGLVSEIVVVDAGSTDRTGAIAEEYGARFEQRSWPGYVAQKNATLAMASQPWVLCLDADEEVSPELAASIRALFVAGGPRENGYEVSRRNFYLGAWIRYVWQPDRKVRLVRAGSAAWMGQDPHDRLESQGVVRPLDGHLFHYSYRNLRDHLERTIQYARVAADSLDRVGSRARWYHLAVSPWLAFVKQIVVKQGWRDGWRGWVIAGATFTKVFAKYAFLYERRWSRGHPDSTDT